MTIDHQHHRPGYRTPDSCVPKKTLILGLAEHYCVSCWLTFDLAWRRGTFPEASAVDDVTGHVGVGEKDEGGRSMDVPREIFIY